MHFSPIRLSPKETSSAHSSPSLGPQERLQMTHCSDREFKLPAWGGGKAAGTSVPIRQASSLPEPCTPDRLLTPLGLCQLFCLYSISPNICTVSSSTAAAPDYKPSIFHTTPLLKEYGLLPPWLQLEEGFQKLPLKSPENTEL